MQNNKVAVERARAAVLAVFPEIDGLMFFLGREHEPSHDLYSFTQHDDNDHVYVARMMGDEFTGGVARIDIEQLLWFEMPSDGILGGHQKHRLFFIALAKTFASKELGISEDEFWCVDVLAKDHHTVDKVFLGKSRRYVLVGFEDNLPVNAYLSMD